MIESMNDIIFLINDSISLSPYSFYILIFIIYCLTLYYLSFPSNVSKDLTKYNWRDVSKRGDPNEHLPPLYLNGWMPVLESTELAPNQVKSIFAFGKDLIVFRGSSGKCYVFDAYCPHLGANLGVGGTVIGESIQCPFHGWTFNEEGNCTHIPGIDSLKNISATLKKYPIIEFNGYICVWYHNSVEEPYWHITDKEIMNLDNLVFRGRYILKMNCHMQELYENLADVQHIPYLHITPGFIGNSLNKTFIHKLFEKIMGFEYTVKWSAGKDSTKHTVDWIFEVTPTIFGFKTCTYRTLGHIMGPAMINATVQVLITKNWMFQVNYFSAIVQTAPFTNELRYYWYSKPGLLYNILCRFLKNESMENTVRDGVIWTNKKYIRNPLLAKNEPLLVECRRWYKQFYDQDS